MRKRYSHLTPRCLAGWAGHRRYHNSALYPGPPGRLCLASEQHPFRAHYRRAIGHCHSPAVTATIVSVVNTIAHPATLTMRRCWSLGPCIVSIIPLTAFITAEVPITPTVLTVLIVAPLAPVATVLLAHGKAATHIVE